MAVLKTTSPWPSTSAPSAAPTKARPSSSTSAAWRFLDGNYHRLVDAVLLDDEDLDALRVRRWHVLADVIGTDRQLAVAAIDEHRQLDGPRASEVHQRIHRGSSRPPVVDDIVHEHDDLAVDVRHVRLSAVRGHAEVPVVAVLADVERTHRDRRPFELHQAVRQPACEVVPLGHDADQNQVAGAAIALEDLVRDPRQRAADLIRIHHGGLQPSLLDRAHASMADPPAAARDSVHRWCRWEEPTSTAANALWYARARSAGGDDADAPPGRRRSVDVGGAVMPTPCPAGPSECRGRCEPGGSRRREGPRRPRARSHRPWAAGASRSTPSSCERASRRRCGKRP